MATTRNIAAVADAAAMTLGELRAFIAKLDAAGAADSTPIHAETSVRGYRLRKLTASAVRFGDKA